MKGNSFPKSQKLKSRKSISGLFDSGRSLKCFPLRAVYNYIPFDETIHSAVVQMGVSVPKRSFKRAVDRNRIKRQIRETYRMHHGNLVEIAKQNGWYLAIMIIYVDRREPDFNKLEKKMIEMLDKLAKHILPKK